MIKIAVGIIIKKHPTRYDFLYNKKLKYNKGK